QTREEPAGGGAVAAIQLLKLSGEATLFTALGDDDIGHRAKAGLEALGLRVEATFQPTPQRRGFTLLGASGGGTIRVMGERLGPRLEDPLDWESLAGTAAVYFTAGDRGALEAARRAKVLTATSRVMLDLAEAHVRLDAVIGSAKDPAESYRPGL